MVRSREWKVNEPVRATPFRSKCTEPVYEAAEGSSSSRTDSKTGTTARSRRSPAAAEAGGGAAARRTAPIKMMQAVRRALNEPPESGHLIPGAGPGQVT